MTQSTDNEIKYIRDLLVEINSDIKSFKKETNTKLDKITGDIATVQTDVAVIKTNQENMKEQLSRIDGTQRAQIWSLIVAVFGIVGLLAIALFKMK